MKYFLRFFQLLYSIYAITLFILLMLLVVPFVIIGSLAGRRYGGAIIYGACHTWADSWLLLIGILHQKVGDTAPRKNEHFIYVANHTSYIDIPQLLKAVRTPFRVLGKIEMSTIPVFGYIYRHAAVTVDRSDAEHRARSVRILEKLIRAGISIFIFPEGTFSSFPEKEPLQAFYDGAFRVAIETQTDIRPLLFLDNVERMHPRSVFSLTPGKMRTLYLPPVSVKGYGMADLKALKNTVRNHMETALRQYREYPG